MKSFVACLMLVAVAVVAAAPGEARPKRSILYAHTAPVVASTVVAAAPVVASVPVVHQTSQVVHHNPTTVVSLPFRSALSGITRSSI